MIRFKRSLPASFLVATVLAAVGCGGGGGGDGGSSNAPRTPAPSPIPVEPPGPDPRPASTARRVLQNGAVAVDGFVVGNIEDAALAQDGSLAIIAAETQGDERAILRMSTDGELRTIFSRINAPDDVDLTTLTRLRMASSGELAFRSGAGRDSDQLHLAIGDEVRTIAGSAGAVAPDFRILGSFRIVRDGLVAFVAGGGDCETDASGDTVRELCTLSLFLADGTDVVSIDHEDFELDRRQATDAQIAMNEDGGLFFSVPGRRTSPVVVRFDETETQVVLRNNGEVPDFGVLSRVDIVDLDSAGRVLVELGIQPEDPDDPVLDHVGLLDGDQLTDFAVEGTREGSQSVFSLRGIGLGGGMALFEATLIDDVTEEQTDCLRLGNAEFTLNLLCEGRPFPGETLEVFSIGGTRINDDGDVLFVTTLGTRQTGTTRVEEVRASVRRVNGEMVTIASSADSDRIGRVAQLTTVGFNNDGQALLIAEGARSSDRALLRGDSR